VKMGRDASWLIIYIAVTLHLLTGFMLGYNVRVWCLLVLHAVPILSGTLYYYYIFNPMR
jgi:hypothetical protein